MLTGSDASRRVLRALLLGAQHRVQHHVRLGAGFTPISDAASTQHLDCAPIQHARARSARGSRSGRRGGGRTAARVLAAQARNGAADLRRATCEAPRRFRRRRTIGCRFADRADAGILVNVGGAAQLLTELAALRRSIAPPSTDLLLAIEEDRVDEYLATTFTLPELTCDSGVRRRSSTRRAALART